MNSALIKVSFQCVVNKTNKTRPREYIVLVVFVLTMQHSHPLAHQRSDFRALDSQKFCITIFGTI